MHTEPQIRTRGTAPSLGTGSSIFDIAAVGIDAVSIVLVGLLSSVGYGAATGIRADNGSFFGAAILASLLFTVMMRSRSLYETGQLLALDRQIRSVAVVWPLSFGGTILLAYLLKAGSDLSRGAGLLFAVSAFVVLCAQRIVWHYGLRRALARGTLRKRQAVLVSVADVPVTAGQIGALRRNGLAVADHIVLHDLDDPVQRSRALADVVAAVRGSPTDEIIVALSGADLARLGEIVDGLHLLPLPVRLLPDASLSRIALQPSRRIGYFALIDIKREPLGPVELAFKRALDVAVATTALLALAPLLVIAMAAVKVDSKGPVLFRQTRRGFNGRTFKILKLRTMTVMEDGAGIVQARRGDARITRVGFWLRRTSIDELPQLWNVLRGDMSVVGPRPHAVAHDNYYDTVIENYAFRHHVKPGLTGWAQVRGYRGETPDIALMAARVDHDSWYINNWSLVLDVRILFLTCLRLFAKTAY